MNCCIASTSAVTRATNTPRFSSDCSAIERRWMCANVRMRRPIIAPSAAWTRRRPARATPRTSAPPGRMPRRTRRAYVHGTEPAVEAVVEHQLDQHGRGEVRDHDAERDDHREPEARCAAPGSRGSRAEGPRRSSGAPPGPRSRPPRGPRLPRRSSFAPFVGVDDRGVPGRPRPSARRVCRSPRRGLPRGR